MPARPVPQPPPAAGAARGALAAPYSPPAVSLPPVTDDTMLAASVRLRVEDPQGHSCGSGTIIDARAGGEALVLTCGHLFREYKGTGKIEVDVFGPAPAARVPGRLLAYDPERDVGLVAFRPQGPVMVARVAPSGYLLRPGDAVATVGCSNGNDPTVEHSRVNSLDHFLDPGGGQGGNAAGVSHAPWNLQVAGQPVIGRSGGGLFSREGMVLGVCNAADPTDQEGLFAALGSVYAALDQQGLGSLYRQVAAAPAMVPPAANAHSAVAAVDPFSPDRFSAARAASHEPPDARPAAASGATSNVVSTAAHQSSAMPSENQAALERIRHLVEEGANVTCIISGPGDLGGKTEVIRLGHNPPAASCQLATARQPQDVPHQTSLELPTRPQPILEWDAEGGWKHQGKLP